MSSQSGRKLKFCHKEGEKVAGGRWRLERGDAVCFLKKRERSVDEVRSRVDFIWELEGMGGEEGESLVDKTRPRGELREKLSLRHFGDESRLSLFDFPLEPFDLQPVQLPTPALYSTPYHGNFGWACHPK